MVVPRPLHGRLRTADSNVILAVRGFQTRRGAKGPLKMALRPFPFGLHQTAAWPWRAFSDVGQIAL
jgi:hypothetical protein